MKIIKILKATKYKFIFFGCINIFISNIILQTLLLYISTVKATFISQMFNYLFGYYFMEKGFQSKGTQKSISLNIQY